MKRYIELKENAAATHIKIEIWYRLEGSKTRPRGYYLTVTPVTRENRSGYMLESFDAFSGYTQLVQPVTRKSAKAEAAAEIIAQNYFHSMVNYVCEKNGLPIPEEFIYPEVKYL